MTTFRDVTVTPYAELLGEHLGRPNHKGGPRWPDWETQPTGVRHCRVGRPTDIEPEPAEPTAWEDEPLAWGGAIVWHFGHQVAEFSMRLFPTVLACPGARVAFASLPEWNLSPPAFFWRILNWYGIPRDHAVILEEPTLVRELSVFPQMEQIGGPGPDGDLLDKLTALTERRLGTIKQSGVLYVSRAGQTARLASEEGLERAMLGAGARVIRPETMVLGDQLRSLASADVVILAEGSAVYSLQLLGRGVGDVVVINRREGWQLALASIEPRARSLTYLDVGLGLVHPLRPSGEPAPEAGITAWDPDALVASLRPFVTLNADGLRASQDQDIAEWYESMHSLVTTPESRAFLRSTIPPLGPATKALIA